MHKLVVVALLTACHAKVDCEAAVAHAQTLQLAVDDGKARSIGQVTLAHCKSDAWSDEVRACYGHAKDAGELARCTDALTRSQQDQLMRDVMPVATERVAPRDAATDSP